MAPRNATRSHPKDAIAMLHADHHKVRQLFRAYRTAKDPATQREITGRIFDALEVHAQLEEVVFYQAVEEETTSLGKRLVHASLEEHQEALQRLYRKQIGDADFARLAEFKEWLSAHPKRELLRTLLLAEIPAQDE